MSKLTPPYPLIDELKGHLASWIKVPAHAMADPLVALQLRVARRADELAAACKERSSLNLPCWLQAEEEILGALRALSNPSEPAMARIEA